MGERVQFNFRLGAMEYVAFRERCEALALSPSKVAERLVVTWTGADFGEAMAAVSLSRERVGQGSVQRFISTLTSGSRRKGNVESGERSSP